MLAAALTPQGKTEGLFSVIHRAPGSYLLIADGGEPQAVLAAFKRYLVADRVDVVDRSPEWEVLHLLPESVEECAILPAQRVGMFAGVCAAARRRAPQQGFDLVGSREQLAAAISGGVELTEANALLLRLRAGVPSFPEELNSETLFSESGLSEAVSFSKGCYVGQEVVEKIDSHGKTARVLRRLSIASNETIASGAIVSSVDGERVGEVLTAVFDPESGRWLAFCTLKNRPHDALRVAETAAAVIV